MSDQNANGYGAGWAWPVVGHGTGANGKAHYYSAGFAGKSLCGKYTLLGGERDDSNHGSPDNCIACRRALAKTRSDVDVKLPNRVPVEVLADAIGDDGWKYLRAGERGYVQYAHGIDGPAAVRAQASRGGTVRFQSQRPKRDVSVRASLLKVL